MPTILSDHNIEGHLSVLARFWTSDEWMPLWRSLGCTLESLSSLGLSDAIPDSELWKLCQERGMILITANRNAEGEESLEATMRRLCQADSLPVLTIANADRVLTDRQYAEEVALKVFDVILELDRVRGTRRLFIP